MFLFTYDDSLVSNLKGLLLPPSSDNQEQLHVFEQCIAEMKGKKMIGRIALEVTAIMQDYVEGIGIEKHSFIVEKIMEGFDKIDHDGTVLKFLPYIWNSLVKLEVINVEYVSKFFAGRESVSTSEYLQYIINKFVSVQWSPSFLIALILLLKDIEPSLKKQDMGKLLPKVFLTAKSLHPKDLPKFTDSVLKFGKPYSSFVLRSICSLLIYFDEKFRNEGSKLCSPDEFIKSKSGILYRSHLVFKQDHEVGKEFFRQVRSKQIELEGFSFAMLLSISSNAYISSQIFAYLIRECSIQHRNEGIFERSAWFGKFRGTNSSVAKIEKMSSNFQRALHQFLSMCLENSSEWELLYTPIIDFGFALMDHQISKKEAEIDVSCIPISQQSNSLSCLRFGCSILFPVYNAHPSLAKIIINQLIVRIVNGINFSMPSVYFLGHLLLHNSSFIRNDSLVGKIKEALSFLYCLPSVTAIAFIGALKPLFDMLHDTLVILLRKMMFSHDAEARVVAIRGFLILMHTNSPVVDNMLSESEDFGERLFHELFPILKRALTCQAAVRVALYDGLSQLFSIRPKLRVQILSLLVTHMSQFISESSKMPFCVEMCFHDDILVEPFSYLLSTVVALIKQIDFDDTVNPECEQVLQHVIKLVTVCSEKFINCSVSGFTFPTETSSIYSSYTKLISDTTDALIEFISILKSEQLDSITVQKILKLFNFWNMLIKPKLNSKPSKKSKALPEDKAVEELDAEKIEPASHYQQPAWQLECLLKLFEFTYLNDKTGICSLNVQFMQFLLDKVNQFVVRLCSVGRKANPVEQLSKLIPYLLSGIEHHLKKSESAQSKKSKSPVMQILESLQLIFELASHENCLPELLSGLFSMKSAPACKFLPRMESLFETLLGFSKGVECNAVLRIMKSICVKSSSKDLELHTVWISEVFTTNEISDANTAKEFTCHYLEIVTENFSNEILLQLANDLRGSFGNISDEIDAASVEWRIVNGKTANALIMYLCQFLDSLYDEVDWFLALLKVHYSAVVQTEKEIEELDITVDDSISVWISNVFTVFDILCTKIHSSVTILLEFVKSNISGTPSESIVKLATHVYKILAMLSKLVLASKRYPSKGYLKLLEVVSRQLTPPMYDFITNAQNTSVSDSKHKVLREKKIYPNLVFKIEQHEHLVLKLSNLKDMDEIKRYLPVTKSRDFKIAENACTGAAKKEASKKAVPPVASTVKASKPKRPVESACENFSPSSAADIAVFNCFSQLSQPAKSRRPLHDKENYANETPNKIQRGNK